MQEKKLGGSFAIVIPIVFFLVFICLGLKLRIQAGQAWTVDMVLGKQVSQSYLPLNTTAIPSCSSVKRNLARDLTFSLVISIGAYQS